MVALAVAALAGCSGGGSSKAAATVTATPERSTGPTTTAAPAVYPLTGLPVSNPATVGRPLLAVKIDNSPEARPQAGLDRADLVVEEVVEGGLVRFMAIFQSQDADRVGPVRSVRPVDGKLLTPIKGYFAYSGGNLTEKALIKQAPLTLVGVDELPAAYTRRRDRRAPHNLYSSTQGIYGRAPAAGGAPPALFAYRAAGTPPSGSGMAPLAKLQIVMGPLTNASWTWDASAGVFRRSTNGSAHTVEGGGQLGFANVVVQFVGYQDRPNGETDSVGAPVPEANVAGTGDAWILSGGMLVKGRWNKANDGAVTTYTDAAGAPVKLAPGSTWLMLAPIGAQVTTQ